jgi:phosphomannomutase / phosphoglucomutase
VKETIFREYDIRGIVNSELHIDQCYNLGQAIVTYLKKQNPKLDTIVVGMDGRQHSKPISDVLIQAIIDLGLDVIYIGLVPTPAMYFTVNYLDFSAGLIVTASHNPKEYNGVKIWDLLGKDIQEIKKIFYEKTFYQNESGKAGVICPYDIVTDYIDYLAEQFSHLQNCSVKAVIDCGNGSAGVVLPRLIQEMGWRDVKLLYADVDGTFPNHEADPTVSKNMQDVALELRENKQFLLGIGFDGDGDRMNPMTKSGYLVPGDQLLALYAQKVVDDYPGAAVVFDIKASSSLIELLEKWEARPIISPSGHSIIKDTLKKHNALLGGELSCHFFFKDRYFGYDDGIYAAMRLIEILQEEKKSLEKLLKIYPQKISSPEIRIKCNTEKEKVDIVNHVKTVFALRKDAKLITIDGVRAQMPYGWGLVRASNTQSVICLRFESRSQNGNKQVKEDFFKALKPFFRVAKLKETIDL